MRCCLKDIRQAGGITSGLELPDSDEFDMFVDLSLTTKQTNEVKQLLQNKNLYKHIHRDFDYLPRTNRKHDPTMFYKLPFRIVRFEITEDTYETVVTNLDAQFFLQKSLKSSTPCVGVLKLLFGN